jgi:hypothetical protein
MINKVRLRTSAIKSAGSTILVEYYTLPFLPQWAVGGVRRRTFIYHSSFMPPCLAGNKSIALAQMKNDE